MKLAHLVLAVLLAAASLSAPARAATLQGIATGQGDKLFTTEFKRDQNLSGQQRGHDVFLRNGAGFAATSFNVNWGVSGTSYDWSLTYDGNTASLIFGGVSRSIDVSPDGTWTAFQIFAKADDAKRLATATTTLAITSVNGMAAATSTSVTNGATDVAYWLGGETLTSIAGTLTFDFVANPGQTGSPNGRLAVSLKALDVAPVPVPAALPLLLVGLGGLALVARRRKTA